MFNKLSKIFFKVCFTYLILILICKTSNHKKDLALAQFKKMTEKSLTLGYKLDLEFHLIRLGMFHVDHELVKSSLEKAQKFVVR